MLGAIGMKSHECLNKKMGRPGTVSPYLHLSSLLSKWLSNVLDTSPQKKVTSYIVFSVQHRTTKLSKTHLFHKNRQKLPQKPGFLFLKWFSKKAKTFDRWQNTLTSVDGPSQMLSSLKLGKAAAECQIGQIIPTKTTIPLKGLD